MFFWTFYSYVNPKNKIDQFPQKKYCAAQLFSTLIIIRNIQHIIMISEYHVTLKTALITEINYSLTHIHIENSFLKLKQ